MTSPNQQTISREAVLEGTGLHTGAPARVQFRPADPNTGIRFRRTDLDGQPIHHRGRDTHYPLSGSFHDLDGRVERDLA